VPGLTLYAYHTDTTGDYGLLGNMNPRLRGSVVTDAEGRFELRTIRPGSYPGRKDPAHIHFEVSGAGYPKQWVDELRFADDPKVTAEHRAESRAKGKFAPIVATTRDDKGVLHANINIRIRLKNDRN
jgi:protocatechuate 3,4-dioxygenase beta subunit